MHRSPDKKSACVQGIGGYAAGLLTLHEAWKLLALVKASRNKPLQFLTMVPMGWPVGEVTAKGMSSQRQQ